MGKTVSVDWNYWFENDKMNEGNLNDEMQAVLSQEHTQAKAKCD